MTSIKWVLCVQDDRMWLQYGGNWAAAGAHGACPEAYKGKAYVNEQVDQPLDNFWSTSPGPPADPHLMYALPGRSGTSPAWAGTTATPARRAPSRRSSPTRTSWSSPHLLP